MMKKIINNLKLQLLNSFPKKKFSQAVRSWAKLPLPQKLLSVQTSLFTNILSIDTDESELPVNVYPTLDALFTRRLKNGARVIDPDENSVVSPSDGTIESYGKIESETMIQAKGLDYTIDELLMDSTISTKFIGGDFLTVYLSPHDYHRVHFPVGGEVTSFQHIPGECFTVGDFARENVPKLYCRNERVVTYIKTPNGMVAVILVAAMGVGNMTLSYLADRLNGEWKTNDSQEFSPMEKEKGDELGIFHLGSTVIVLFERDKLDFTDLEPGSAITMGKPVAHWR
jgi:phosphatidylserine decarboxylase